MTTPLTSSPLYIFANVNFLPDAYATWQGHYDGFASYVLPNEPNTLTYYFGVPLEYASDMSKTTHMLAFEAYAAREDLYETHFHSNAMEGFLKEIPGCMSTGLDLSHYECVAGWLDKAATGVGCECEIMREMRVKCKDGESRKTVLGKLGDLVAGVEEGGDGALTLMVFKSLDEDVGVRIFGRWTERDEMERFDRRNDVMDFWLGSKNEVIQMEWKCYVPNGKGWLHR